jgi:hypothetical protein
MPNRSTQNANASHRIVVSRREIADPRRDIVTSRREITAAFREIGSTRRQKASARQHTAVAGRQSPPTLAQIVELCADVAPLDHHDLPRPVNMADRDGQNARREWEIVIHAQRHDVERCTDHASPA